MNEEEFLQKYRGRFLLFLTEAWACRTHKPSELGLLLDHHSRQLEGLLRNIYANHVAAVANGVPKPIAERK